MIWYDIYIYRERERERERDDIYIYIFFFFFLILPTVSRKELVPSICPGLLGSKHRDAIKYMCRDFTRGNAYVKRNKETARGG